MDIEKIETLAQYIEYVDKLPLEFSLSRGQTIDKPLLPSGMRTDESGNRIYSKTQLEQIVIKFKSNSYQYIRNTGDVNNNYEWLVYAQHFGIPTRLLDFTFSPLTSLLFALENTFQFNDISDDAVVWFLNPVELNKLSASRTEIINISENKDIDLNTKELPVVIASKMINHRVDAQKGCFVYFQNDSLALEQNCNSDTYLRKVIIPANKRKSILVSLYKIGYRFINLYPELDSIAKDVKLEINVIDYLKGLDAND